mmetsp:Transcript_7717/g.11140  ORF Transcript_7717/g.11140 Transcript_7717/m.11140 type:complete len:187 (-) Transcript_7717:410-970(-)|eukprot:CAMPEP_0202449262 /NCGR_PEP_ID=MMETSP1360-20130828/8010_1 /ASSEMBLY_ACC=CAM_ASM_000848 /TAXON_ID=515479 /ORGANISM="Licmophora paradoxa, Strain CCMP2313" /LENGTH=186 /DNA_ID=CAMNT_0049067127 /DNA_START=181 /DNA_END=741 /DNA_ORIENTATION=-
MILQSSVADNKKRLLAFLINEARKDQNTRNATLTILKACIGAFASDRNSLRLKNGINYCLSRRAFIKRILLTQSFSWRMRRWSAAELAAAVLYIDREFPPFLQVLPAPNSQSDLTEDSVNAMDQASTDSANPSNPNARGVVVNGNGNGNERLSRVAASELGDDVDQIGDSVDTTTHATNGTADTSN